LKLITWWPQDHLSGPDRLAWRARFATASMLPTATIATLTGYAGPVLAVAVAELDGRPVAVTGGADETVRVWDLAEQGEIGTLTGGPVLAGPCSEYGVWELRNVGSRLRL
jgi:WD40 repeat protein